MQWIPGISGKMDLVVDSKTFDGDITNSLLYSEVIVNANILLFELISASISCRFLL
jgi:hypothetical protein